MNKIITGLDLNGSLLTELTFSQTSDRDSQTRFLVTHNNMVVGRIDIVLNKGILFLNFKDYTIKFLYEILVIDSEYKKLLSLNSFALYHYIADNYIAHYLNEILIQQYSAIIFSAFQLLRNINANNNYNVNIIVERANSDFVDFQIKLECSTGSGLNYRINEYLMIITVDKSSKIYIDKDVNNINYYSNNITNNIFTNLKQNTLKSHIFQYMAEILSYYLNAY